MPEIINPDIDSKDGASAAGHKVAAELDSAIKSNPTLLAALRGAAHRHDAEDEKKPDPVDDPKHDEDGDEGTALARLATVAETLGNLVESLGSRIDALEEKSTADEDEDEPRSKRFDTRRRRRDEDVEEEDGKPTPVAADSAMSFGPKSEVYFSTAQAAADAVYSAFGGNAPPPLAGEGLLAYRRRLLRPLVEHSATFKGTSVDTLSANRNVFDRVEKLIHADAIAASRNNALVPSGYLQERKTKNDAGHTMVTFVGSPMAWMQRFMPTGRAVTKINTRPPTEPARW